MEVTAEMMVAASTALARAQGKMEKLLKGKLNPHFKSKYADLATVWDVCREPLTSEGFSVLQIPVEPSAPGMATLKTMLIHSSGAVIEETFSIPVSKPNDPQSVGSALTYAKRYVLLGLAGIAPEDDDGNTANSRPAPSAQVVDYSSTVAEAKDELAKCKSASEGRQLYGLVRTSSIAEPAKTALLNEMKETILKRWPNEK